MDAPSSPKYLMTRPMLVLMDSMDTSTMKIVTGGIMAATSGDVTTFAAAVASANATPPRRPAIQMTTALPREMAAAGGRQ